MVRSWIRLIWNSLGVAVVAAAAQLGAATALHIIRWDENFQNGDAAGWHDLLTWVVFVYAASVLAGAAVGRRALRRPGRPESAVARITAALVAAVGATVAIGLTWLPARSAKPPVAVHPELVVAMTAVAGVIAGLLLALLALLVPPVAGSLRAAAAWAWAVGIASAVAEIGASTTVAPPRLGLLDAPSVVPSAWWSGPLLVIVVSAVLGVVVAGMARFGGAHRLAVAICGGTGPAIIAASYLIAGTGDFAGLTPSTAAALAVVAGLVGSGLVALPPRRAPHPTSAARTRQIPMPTSTTHQPTVRPTPTSAPPATGVRSAPVPAQPVMGQPPQSISDESYSDWLRDLGHVPS